LEPAPNPGRFTNDLLTGNYRYTLFEKYWPIAQCDSFSAKAELAAS
jgi:hypothetical protein